MKFAYFNPTVMAVDDVTAEQYSKLREIVNTAHEHGEHNDEGNPNISIRGGQQIQIVPNEFKLDTTFLSQYQESMLLHGVLTEALSFLKGPMDLYNLYKSKYNEEVQAFAIQQMGRRRRAEYDEGVPRIKVDSPSP